MDLRELREILGLKDIDFFYETTQIASRGGSTRTFFALFMNRGKWLSVEEIATYSSLSPNTVIHHGLPPLVKSGLVEKGKRNGENVYRFVPFLDRNKEQDRISHDISIAERKKIRSPEDNL